MPHVSSLKFKHKHLTTVIVFCLMFRLPASGQHSSQQEMQSVLNRQAAAWNKGDIDGYMNGYWKSDSLIFTSGGKIQRGWGATLDKYKKSYNSKEKMGTLEFSQLEFHELSPDAAWVLGHWELQRKADHPNGVFTLIFRKFPEGWKIVHDHTSADTSQK